MNDKITIEDDSGDKEFFTIIPNYILNHSTALDQALYSQLKRLSGDGKNDFCYPSHGYLMKQLKVGKVALKKSFYYLIENKWVSFLGKKRVMTKGGYQWVNAYKINNIWNTNNEYYKGGSEIAPLNNKGGLKSAKGVLKQPKGGLVMSRKEELIKELKKEPSSFKNKKPYYKEDEMRYKKGEAKWYVIQDGQWLEYGGTKDEIEWR